MHKDYQRVLFVGPGLHGGTLGEAFRRELKALRNEDAGTRVIDTLDGFDSLWAALEEPLPENGAALLVVDLEPSSDSAYLDWLRDELGRLARAHPQAPQLWITAQALGRRVVVDGARLVAGVVGGPSPGPAQPARLQGRFERAGIVGVPSRLQPPHHDNPSTCRAMMSRCAMVSPSFRCRIIWWYSAGSPIP